MLTILHRVKSRDVIVRRYHVVGKIIPEILGFELASFSDKKPEHILVRLKQQYKNRKYF